MNDIPVKIKLIHEDAKVPIYGSEEAAGFDLYSVERKNIPPGWTVLVGTGIHMEIPLGYCVQIWDRSGMGAKGIHRFAGLIDSDYRGEYKVVLHNSSSETFKVDVGDRIAQAAIVPYFKAVFEEVDELIESRRGDGGFGSTGK